MYEVHEAGEAGGNGEAMETAPRTRLKGAMILGLVSALIIVAAFTAGRLLGEDPQVGEPQESEFVVSKDGDQAVGMGVMLEPDARLPDGEPAASGQFHHRQDNTLFISQFPMTSGVVYLDTVEEWPVVEVLVTKDTLVFKDVTDFSSSTGGGPVQQEVAPGLIDEIREGSTVMVWGEMRGERLIAEVVQYFSA